jgi:hypothetical protein
VRRGFSPLDRRLRLRRDSWSEGLVREAARLGTTQPSFEIAAETLNRLAGVWMSDSTVWRRHQEVTSQIEGQLMAEEQRLPCWPCEQEEGAKAWIVAQEPIAEHVNVSIDGLTVLIRKEGYREVKMVAVSEVVVSPLARSESVAAEGEEEQERVEAGDAGRMAATGDGGSDPMEGQEAEYPLAEEARTEKPEAVAEATATGQERGRGRQDGLKLLHHSYRAVLGEKAVFRPALAGELTRRRVDEAAKISTVNDGAEWIWDLVQDLVPPQRVEALDWPHAVQNLAKAGEAAWGEGTQAAQGWLAERETELWDGQVTQVQVALEQLPRRRKERGKAIRQVQEYVAQHAERMDYARFRAEGRPIGSGTVESGAKNVVGWRMKRGGQSWSRPGAIRMLAALGEVHSGRWDNACHRLAKAA